jgi:hypothetical protein
MSATLSIAPRQYSYSAAADAVIEYAFEDNPTPAEFDEYCGLHPEYHLFHEDKQGKYALLAAFFHYNFGLMGHIIRKGGKELVSLRDRWGCTALTLTTIRAQICQAIGPHDIFYSNDPVSYGFCPPRLPDQRFSLIAQELIQLGADIHNEAIGHDHRAYQPYLPLPSLPQRATPLWIVLEQANDIALATILINNQAKISPALSIKGCRRLRVAQQLSESIKIKQGLMAQGVPQIRREGYWFQRLPAEIFSLILNFYHPQSVLDEEDLDLARFLSLVQFVIAESQEISISNRFFSEGNSSCRLIKYSRGVSQKLQEKYQARPHSRYSEVFLNGEAETLGHLRPPSSALVGEDVEIHTLKGLNNLIDQLENKLEKKPTFLRSTSDLIFNVIPYVAVAIIVFSVTYGIFFSAPSKKK